MAAPIADTLVGNLSATDNAAVQPSVLALRAGRAAYDGGGEAISASCAAGFRFEVEGFEAY